MAEAAKHQVLPIDDRGIERFNPAIAGRPDLLPVLLAAHARLQV
jgi:arylsulfatase